MRNCRRPLVGEPGLFWVVAALAKHGLVLNGFLAWHWAWHLLQQRLVGPSRWSVKLLPMRAR